MTLSGTDPGKKYVVGIETDYEEGTTVPGLSFMDRHGVLARRIEGSTSVNSNCVWGNFVTDDLNSAVGDIFGFFSGTPFSWSVEASAENRKLLRTLKSHGMECSDRYVGMLRKTGTRDHGISVPDVSMTEVTSKEQIRSLVDLTARVWGIGDQTTKERMIKERESYLNMKNRRGGFITAFIGQDPVGYSRYRLSSDGEALYLNGAGVLLDFRNRHVYSSMLEYRENLAYSMGAGLTAVAAREGSSAPILSKLGYREVARYYLMSTLRR